jgi:ATP phosphoribosyltransferase
MVVQEAYKQQQEQIQEYQSHRLTKKKARTIATSYYRLVKQFVSQFITIAYGGRDPTPIQ